MTFEEAVEVLRAGGRVRLARRDDDQVVYLESGVVRVEGIQRMTPRIDHFLQRALEGPWQIAEEERREGS